MTSEKADYTTVLQSETTETPAVSKTTSRIEGANCPSNVWNS